MASNGMAHDTELFQLSVAFGTFSSHAEACAFADTLKAAFPEQVIPSSVTIRRSWR